MLTFQDLGLSENLLKGVQALGFEHPTPIQEKVISLLLQDTTDVVALAQTGTGKTAAFGLPVAQNIALEQRQTQALVLTPTRELCNQITTELTNYTRFLPGMKIAAVYGGEDIVRQMRRIAIPPHILVATPGRLVDMIDRGKVHLGSLRYLILDEADEMLNMGFKEDLTKIIEQMPTERRTMLFSATMPTDVAQIAKRYLVSPTEITVGKKNAGSDNVTHEYYVAHAKDRYQVLKRIVDINPDIYGIVFCRTRQETQEIASKLMKDGYDADALHGDLTQAARDQVMEKFRLRNLHLLVATDVAARGIDVNNLTHVINFSLPENAEIYNHRSGRTGRANNKGICVSIINMHERWKIKNIERTINKTMVTKRIPTGEDIWKAQLFAHIDKVQQVELDHEHIDPILNAIYEKIEHLDRNEIISRFVMLEFTRLLHYYKDAPDLNVQFKSGDVYRNTGNRMRPDQQRYERGGNRFERKNEGRYEGKSERRSGDFERKGTSEHSRSKRSSGPQFRLAINVGSEQNMSPKQLLGMINDAVGHKNINVGNITIEKDKTMFNVPSYEAEVIMVAFSRRFKKNKIHIEMV